MKVGLLPGQAKSFYESGDYFEGAYEGIRFRASSVETYEPDNSTLTVFDGQVIVFQHFMHLKPVKPLFRFSQRNKVGR